MTTPHNARRYFGIRESREGPGVLDSTRRAIRNQNDLAEEQPAFEVALDKLCGELAQVEATH